MRRQQERDDQLILLATIAHGLGADLADYEPPSYRVEEYLAGAAGSSTGDRAAQRRLEVLAVIEAAGGEAG